MLGACVSTPSTSDKPVVVVSIQPQKYFIDRNADTLVQVEVMVPPGSSPETYEPTPRQLMQFSQATIFFSLGLLSFEQTSLADVAKQSPQVKTVNHSKGLDLIEGHHHHHDHDDSHGHHAHGHGVDPHVWVSLIEVRTMIAQMLDALISQLPEYKEDFERNAALFLADIDKLHQHIQSTFDGYQGSKFFIFHPAFSYYARDYGLEQVAFEEEGKSPSAQHLKKVLQQANAEGIRTIFIQKEFDVNIAQTAAADIGGRVEVIDPLEGEWLSNMYSITSRIKSAIIGE